MNRCGSCGLTLNTSGLCSRCDRPRLTWWEELDLDWEAELIALDALGATS